MSYSRWSHFFNNYSAYFGAAGATVGYLAHLIPNVWGMGMYQKFVSHYQDGIPVPVDPDSTRLMEECGLKLLWPPAEEASVQLFTVLGFDVCHKGSVLLSRGAVIGVPFCFRYRQISDINSSRITVDNQAVNWNLPASQKLLESLIFSEDARRFAIARELHSVRTFYPHYEGLLAALSVSFAYLLGVFTNHLYSLPGRMRLLGRLIVYSALGGIGLLCYCFMEDGLRCFFENRWDRLAGKMGPEFAAGGVQFYDQLIKRRLAIREMYGDRGHKVATVYGNEPYLLRQPHVPLNARRDAMAALMSSVAEKQTDSTKNSELPVQSV